MQPRFPKHRKLNPPMYVSLKKEKGRGGIRSETKKDTDKTALIYQDARLSELQDLVSDLFIMKVTND